MSIPERFSSPEFWGAHRPKMSSDEADAFEAWQTIQRQNDRIETLSRVLLDVEGSLLAYWTDIPQAEVERLWILIRETLGNYEPLTTPAQEGE